MKTIQRGFIVPLLLVIIALLLAGGGTYLYTQKKSANPPTNFVPPTATHATQQSVDTVVIITPATGSTLPLDQKIIVRWTVPKTVVSSFPKDFDLNLFLHAESQDGFSVIAPINDGNNFLIGSAEWDIPGYISSGQLKSGTYKIIWYLQATPKDKNRLCALQINKDCSLSEADLAVVKRASEIKGVSGLFVIKSN